MPVLADFPTRAWRHHAAGAGGAIRGRPTRGGSKTRPGWERLRTWENGPPGRGLIAGKKEFEIPAHIA